MHWPMVVSIICTLFFGAMFVFSFWSDFGDADLAIGGFFGLLLTGIIGWGILCCSIPVGNDQSVVNVQQAKDVLVNEKRLVVISEEGYATVFEKAETILEYKSGKKPVYVTKNKKNSYGGIASSETTIVFQEPEKLGEK